MWNHRSDFIKYGPNIFKICLLVALSSAYIDLDLGFSSLVMIVMYFIKSALIGYGILYIDSNDPNIVGSWQPLEVDNRWKLTTVWWIWDWSMNPGEIFDTSMVGHLGILFVLVRMKIGQGFSNSGRFFGGTFMSNFIVIIFSLEIYTGPEHL